LIPVIKIVDTILMDPEIIDPAEDCCRRTPREILAECGYAPISPSQLDDRQLPGKFWELIYAAARA
jgi:hypothetical protein